MSFTHISNFPKEIIFEIFSYFTEEDIQNAMRVSKNWKQLILSRKEELKMAIFIDMLRKAKPQILGAYAVGQFYVSRRSIWIESGGNKIIFSQKTRRIAASKNSIMILFVDNDVYIERHSKKKFEKCEIKDIDTKTVLNHIKVPEKKYGWPLCSRPLFNFDRKRNRIVVISANATSILIKNEFGKKIEICRTTLKKLRLEIEKTFPPFIRETPKLLLINDNYFWYSGSCDRYSGSCDTSGILECYSFEGTLCFQRSFIGSDQQPRCLQYKKPYFCIFGKSYLELIDANNRNLTVFSFDGDLSNKVFLGADISNEYLIFGDNEKGQLTLINKKSMEKPIICSFDVYESETLYQFLTTNEDNIIVLGCQAIDTRKTQFEFFSMDKTQIKPLWRMQNLGDVMQFGFSLTNLTVVMRDGTLVQYARPVTDAIRENDNAQSEKKVPFLIQTASK